MSEIQAKNPDIPKIIFVLGGPGAGKGTQCSLIVKNLGYVHLSAGDLLREERKKTTQDAEGNLIQDCIKEGKIVPSYITTSLIRKAMIKNGWNRRFLIDGFPRNQQNCDNWFEEMSDFTEFQFVLFLDCSQETMAQRIIQRAQENISLGMARSDDTEQAIQQRFDVFKQSSKQIIDQFASRNRVLQINSDRESNLVYQDLQPFFNRPQIYKIIGGDDGIRNQIVQKISEEFGLVVIDPQQETDSKKVVDLVKETVHKFGSNQKYLLNNFPRNKNQSELWNKQLILPLDNHLIFVLQNQKVQEEEQKDDSKQFQQFLSIQNQLISYDFNREINDLTNDIRLNFLQKPKIVFVLGGPGSGQGTQCAKIVQKFGFVHLSAGDLLREQRASGSKDAQLIESIIKQGKIVPSSITTGLLKKAMIKHGWGKNVLIDGFPRNQENFDSWSEIMGNITVFSFVLYLECSFDTMTARVIERSKLSGRTDDTPQVLVKRFQTYLESTKPVIEYYEKRKKVVTINAQKSVEEVFSIIDPIFQNL